jgi:hypothetical protein
VAREDGPEDKRVRGVWSRASGLYRCAMLFLWAIGVVLVSGAGFVSVVLRGEPITWQGRKVCSFAAVVLWLAVTLVLGALGIVMFRSARSHFFPRVFRNRRGSSLVRKRAAIEGEAEQAGDVDRGNKH